MLLADAPMGSSFTVIMVRTGREVGKRLADMGFTLGAEGAVVRGGFFHGPLQVRIRGYDVLLRRSEALAIEVEPTGDWAATVAGGASARRFGRGRGRGHGRGLGYGHGHGHGFGPWRAGGSFRRDAPGEGE
jgi:ferrous iron transport protein A